MNEALSKIADELGKLPLSRGLTTVEGEHIIFCLDRKDTQKTEHPMTTAFRDWQLRIENPEWLEKHIELKSMPIHSGEVARVFREILRKERFFGPNSLAKEEMIAWAPALPAIAATSQTQKARLDFIEKLVVKHAGRDKTIFVQPEVGEHLIKFKISIVDKPPAKPKTGWLAKLRRRRK